MSAAETDGPGVHDGIVAVGWAMVRVVVGIAIDRSLHQELPRHQEEKL